MQSKTEVDVDINPEILSVDVSKPKDKLHKYSISTKTTFLALILSTVVDMLGFSMVLPLLPSIATSYGASAFMVGIITAANSFAALLSAPIWGKFSDKYGRKPILLINQVGTVFAFILLSSSNGIGMIIASRLVDGIFGGQFPVIKSIISDITESESRTEQMSSFVIAMSLSTMFGPSIGGLLGGISWRIPGIFAAVCGTISIFLTIKYLPETMPKERREDLKKEYSDKIIESSVKSNEQKDTKSKRKNIFTPEFTLRLAQVFLFNVMFQMFFSSLSLILDMRYALGVTSIGWYMTIMSLAMMVFGGILLKPLKNKLGEKKLITIAVGVSIFAYVTFGGLNESWMIIIFMLLMAFGVSYMRPIIQTNLTRGVRDDQQGVASGWSTNIQSIAETIAPLISTAILDIGIFYLFGGGYTSYWVIGIVGAIIGCILVGLVVYDYKKYGTHLKSKKVDENEKKDAFAM